MIAVRLILGHPSGGRNEESVSEFTSLLLCHKIKFTSLWALEKLKIGQSLPIELSSQIYITPPPQFICHCFTVHRGRSSQQCRVCRNSHKLTTGMLDFSASDTPITPTIGSFVHKTIPFWFWFLFFCQTFTWPDLKKRTENSGLELMLVLDAAVLKLVKAGHF